MSYLQSAVVRLAIATGIATGPIGSAAAGDVLFSLTDTGLFDAADPNTVIGTRLSDQLNGLLYSAHPFPYFLGTSTAGALSFELGTFARDDAIPNYTGHAFTLGLLFVTPTNITGGNAVGGGATTSAALLDDVAGERVLVDFDNAPTHFAFSSSNELGLQQGTFDLALDDVFVAAGGTGKITGHITNAVQQQVSSIPEPATFLLLASGIIGMAGARWRSRSAERGQISRLDRECDSA